MKVCPYTHQKLDLFCRQVSIDKRKLFLDDIEGHPYGTTFELKDGKMVKVDSSCMVEAEQAGMGNLHWFRTSYLGLF